MITPPVPAKAATQKLDSRFRGNEPMKKPRRL
jgi:hypothetical protein